MDPVFKAALEREAELEQELKKVRDFLTLYRTLASSINLESENGQGTNVPSSTPDPNVVDRTDAERAREAKAPDAAPPKRVRVTDNPKPTDVVAAAAEVIRRAGRPMTRREIHLALQTELGMLVRGADPIKALGTMLWRSGANELEQIEGRGYWIKGLPVPKPGETMSPEAQLLFS